MDDDSTGVSEDFNSAFTYKVDSLGISIEFNVSNAALSMKNPFITKVYIGDFPDAGQQLEDPKGNPMVVDKDIFGNIRNASSPRVGPFENLVAGKNVFRFGYVPYSGETTATVFPRNE